MSTNDKKKQNTSKEEEEVKKNKSGKIAQDKKDAEKDPHRGTTDTPPQDKDMMPRNHDPEGGRQDDDGTLDEELEDIEDDEK